MIIQWAEEYVECVIDTTRIANTVKAFPADFKK